MEKIILVALSDNNVIGNNGRMPWQRIPADMNRFRKLTWGHPAVMGRKTYEALIAMNGKPLEGRLNIVATRGGKTPGFYVMDGVKVCYSIGAAFEEAGICNEIMQDFHQFSKHPGEYENKVYIIGGEQIYRQTMNLADKLKATRVHINAEGDAHFPEINPDIWKIENQEDFPSQDGVPSYSFMDYVRR